MPSALGSSRGDGGVGGRGASLARPDLKLRCAVTFPHVAYQLQSSSARLTVIHRQRAQVEHRRRHSVTALVHVSAATAGKPKEPELSAEQSLLSPVIVTPQKPFSADESQLAAMT